MKYIYNVLWWRYLYFALIWELKKVWWISTLRMPKQQMFPMCCSIKITDFFSHHWAFHSMQIQKNDCLEHLWPLPLGNHSLAGQPKRNQKWSKAEWATLSSTTGGFFPLAAVSGANVVRDNTAYIRSLCQVVEKMTALLEPSYFRCILKQKGVTHRMTQYWASLRIREKYFMIVIWLR